MLTGSVHKYYDAQPTNYVVIFFVGGWWLAEGPQTLVGRPAFQQTFLVLKVFCFDGFPYVIAPVFSTPAFSTPTFSAPPPRRTEGTKRTLASSGTVH